MFVQYIKLRKQQLFIIAGTVISIAFTIVNQLSVCYHKKTRRYLTIERDGKIYENLRCQRLF